MAGGNWKFQNKIRPGAYINFKAINKNLTTVGERGILTMPVVLNWGKNNAIIEVNTADFADNLAIAQIGYSANDPEAQTIRCGAKYAAKLLLYRVNIGEKASVSFNEGLLVATAKYSGTFGNNLAVAIKEKNNKWVIETYVNNSLKASEEIKKNGKGDGLKGNEWVEFSGTTALSTLTTAPATALTGGTNQASGENIKEQFASYLTYLNRFFFNTMAIPFDLTATGDRQYADLFKQYIVNRREVEGKKCQVVLYKDDGNIGEYGNGYEGVISVRNGFITADETISPLNFVAYFGGMTAGAEVNESNTYKVIDGATDIIYQDEDPYDNDKVIEFLQNGQVVLSTNIAGDVVVEKDINTLREPYREDAKYEFSKNRVIRCLDEINDVIRREWEVSFAGQVDNNERGRSQFADRIGNFLSELSNSNAIESNYEYYVVKGNDIESVICNLAIQPVDAVEKLYCTVEVN